MMKKLGIPLEGAFTRRFRRGMHEGITCALSDVLMAIRIPLHWYDEYDHIGYDVHGKKIIKSKRADGVEQAIAR